MTDVCLHRFVQDMGITFMSCMSWTHWMFANMWVLLAHAQNHRQTSDHNFASARPFSKRNKQTDWLVKMWFSSWQKELEWRSVLLTTCQKKSWREVEACSRLRILACAKRSLVEYTRGLFQNPRKVSPKVFKIVFFEFCVQMSGSFCVYLNEETQKYGFL